MIKEDRLKSIYELYLQFPNICTDTREIIPNSIFFCLKGESFDGNVFAMTAIEKGAAFVVTENYNLQNHPQCICVDDALSVLQQLSLFHRRQYSIPVIGITGTNGKTTTKELIVAVLQKKYKVAYTKGNLNNHIGVPLTLLSIRDTDEVAVVEMGANHIDEIAQLCRLALPNYGLITNIGTAHIEGFGSFENIVIAKRALFDSVRAHQGTFFVNAQDELLCKITQGYESLIYYGEKIFEIEYPKEEKLLSPFLSFIFHKKKIQTHLTGRYNMNNILAAVAIGSYFKVSENDIVSAIEEYTPKNNRSQIIQQGSNMIIADFYNANPSSMEVALTNLAELAHPNKLAILGEMRELGEVSSTEHEKIIHRCEHLHIDTIFVGPEFCKHHPKLSFDNVEAMNDYLQKNPITEKLILIKGSRGVHLEKIQI